MVSPIKNNTSSKVKLRHSEYTDMLIVHKSSQFPICNLLDFLNSLPVTLSEAEPRKRKFMYRTEGGLHDLN